MGARTQRIRAARACPTCKGRQTIPAPWTRSGATVPCAACLATGTYTDPRIVTRVGELEREVAELRLDLEVHIHTGGTS